MDKKDPEKKAKLLTALDKGMVMIHLDARRPGVLVPPSLRNESHLRLNLSYRFEPPDLSVGEWGVRCTLSFSGSRFKVAVPWSALFAITSHVTKESWTYPDDLPPELLQSVEPVVLPERPRAVLREVTREETTEEPSAPPVSAPVAMPSIAAVPPAPVPLAPVEPEAPKDEPPSPKRGGHLRLVK